MLWVPYDATCRLSYCWNLSSQLIKLNFNFLMMGPMVLIQEKQTSGLHLPCFSGLPGFSGNRQISNGLLVYWAKILLANINPSSNFWKEKLLCSTAWKVYVFGVFLVVFSSSRTEYGKIRSYSVRMCRSTDQKNSEYGQFSRSAGFKLYIQLLLLL